MSHLKILQLLHFNDVYNVEEGKQEPVAGAARFTTALKAYGAGKKSMVLFSGDCLSPSLISTITQGRHIPPILNEMHVQCSALGNHEFDYGMDILAECIGDCNFPWINSNLYDAETNELIQPTIPYLILEHEGLKCGIIGLIEKEWVDTIACFSSSAIHVADFCQVGAKMANQLKTSDKCDLVIALTHMRWPNDRLLASKVPEIDLVLGGHDHDHQVEWIQTDQTAVNDQSAHRIKERLVVKSGSDYRTFSYLKIYFDCKSREVTNITVDKVEVDSSWEPNSKVANMITKLTSDLDKRLDICLGRIEVPLDARFSSVRLHETNIGNFICDTMLTAVDADVVLMNSGTVRADRIIPAGNFTIRDLKSLLPMLDSSVVLEVTGAQLVQALENSVSQHPKLEGRFPIVGGIRFAFDASKPPGERILTSEITIQNQPLDLAKKYRVCVKNYIAEGNDGYKVFTECPVLMDSETCPVIFTSIQNYFRTISVLRGFTKTRSRHRQSIVSIVEQRRLLNDTRHAAIPKDSEPNVAGWQKAKCVLIYQKEMQNSFLVAPKVDGRIRQIN